jgi:hypothetical protein
MLKDIRGSEDITILVFLDDEEGSVFRLIRRLAWLADLETSDLPNKKQFPSDNPPEEGVKKSASLQMNAITKKATVQTNSVSPIERIDH